MNKRRSLLAIAAMLLACVLPAATSLGAEHREFPLAEPSAFGINDTFVRGQAVECTCDREPGVKYPRFESTAPLYGKVAFGDSLIESGTAYHFAIDESKGLGKSYDILYFDLNRNGDLTDDSPLVVMSDPPKGAKPSWPGAVSTCFAWLDLPLDYGDGIGVKPFRVLPRLCLWGSGYRQLYFVSPVVRQGDIFIGGWKHRITLAQAYGITGRFDGPGTYVMLTGGRPGSNDWWLGHDRLGAMHCVGGRMYRLSTTPLGDKLFVDQYTGDTGIFRLSAGNRKVDKLELSGSLESTDTYVPVMDDSGKAIYSGGTPAVSECRLPVGDYTMAMVNVELGRLAIGISNNYHSDGHPRDVEGRAVVFGVKIRKDAPFVLDFSNKPEVIFASPGKDAIFKPGDTVEAKAFLVDPVLDIMIRTIYNRAEKHTQAFKFADGTSAEGEAPTTLEPTVTITNASGKAVASGAMPFG